ncbi:hypothetical protein C6361_00305 [Plantactinospora sp. BC1]|uniref:hypothetical protein n=1 Tax=Plantactinospora sp. BC1 TaxID=2108470 RepID=UPI000D1591B7|nr:hypothetical protein [Plantactinospora sp. BC1]AVT28196.1 hypothetical protein C6361_00305 [Plantactinospora sp. BC1]
MDLLPLLATAVGAVIALSGTLLTDVRRDRRQRVRDDEQVRREVCVDFVLALNLAHAGLREVGEASVPADERRAAVSRVIHEAGLYGARERLLVAATAPLVKAGETVFGRLVAIRTVIRAGARTNSREYHDAYHPFAEALWQFRMSVRADFGQPSFSPESVDRPSWSERESCAFCSGG